MTITAAGLATGQWYDNATSGTVERFGELRMGAA